jgi:DNA-binding PucR family transcriptional regulator
LFEGLPEAVQAQFLQEVLPDDAYSGLSAELRETVFAFLEHGQQLADTARSLYIHRNTLNYRLDRIAELTGLDVRQPLPAWTLWVALTLRRAR